MNDKEFLEFLYDDIPCNHNVHKYLMVTRNKLREYKSPVGISINRAFLMQKI